MSSAASLYTDCDYFISKMTQKDFPKTVCNDSIKRVRFPISP